MGYRIKRGETPTEAVARIAQSQTAVALQDLVEPDALGVAEAIHDCRKRCRKMRGLLLLARPSGSKRARNLDRAYRDAARSLSGYRDAHATLATLDRLIAVTPELPPGIGPVRRELVRRAEAASAAVAHGTPEAQEALDEARRHLTTAAESLDGWRTDGDDWDALGPGLRATYRRGAEALEVLAGDASPACSHELRKAAKYTWYHLRLLQRSAPSILVPLAEGFEGLVECLGDANDLAVLQLQLEADSDAFGDPADVAATRDFLDRHRRAMRRSALSRARRLYVERPRDFERRLGGYWSTWRRYGAERPTGPIGAAEQLDALDDGLDALTVAQLRPLARELGLPGLSSRRRHELLADLRAHGIAIPITSP